MDVAVRSQRLGGLVPDVMVFDEDLLPIESRTLVNGGGQFLMQATSIDPNKEYFIRVSSDESTLFTAGDYQLTVSFSDRATELDQFVEGTVSQDNQQDVNRLHIATPQLIHFALDVAEQGR